MATSRQVVLETDTLGKIREVEVFTFKAPAKRKAKETKKVVQKKEKKLDVKAVKLDSLESARHEVHNLGITGFTGRNKIEAELSRLKKLGAKIPKNWERKMERKKKNLEYERRRQDIKMGVKTKKVSLADPNKPKEKPDKKEEGSVFDSKVGKYRDGVQYISAEEIKKIQSMSKKK